MKWSAEGVERVALKSISPGLEMTCTLCPLAMRLIGFF